MEDKDKKKNKIGTFVDDPEQKMPIDKKSEEEKVSVVEDILHIIGFGSKENDSEGNKIANKKVKKTYRNRGKCYKKKKKGRTIFMIFLFSCLGR